VVAAVAPQWVPHPEVWLLVGGLVGLYAYAARVIGPKVVPAGVPSVTRSQWRWFGGGIVLLWVAADWPVHDIGEQHLYLVHMAQHTVLTLLIPPMLLMATPEWLARLVLGRGRVDHWVHTLARPIPAAIAFNALALLSHWQVVVNTASQNGLFHYGMHTAIVVSAFLLWIPVCGPLPELRISMPAQMLYLFVTSIVPTVPGAWLVFAEGAVYSVYDIPDRLWGVSVTSDQQVAGAIMKLGAGTYLWVIIAVLFFTWASRHAAAEQVPSVRAAGGTLTWDQVQAELDRLPPGPEEARPSIE
ncbi:MAG TPA: cytochrome c oxidase assembly protein, partial [Candidatus Limnocylindria bacterium]|nr:cytochrome c oxidase assembly protein [Candidatus Limnocylindria bacterium]